MAETRLDGGGCSGQPRDTARLRRTPTRRDGNTYVTRTYVSDQNVQTVVYRNYSYNSVRYVTYVPPVYYAPPFYGWAYNRWPPVAWTWGWAAAPWSVASVSYFQPYPVYPTPTLWLTDYVLAENLRASYAAQAAANAQRLRRRCRARRRRRSVGAGGIRHPGDERSDRGRRRRCTGTPRRRSYKRSRRSMYKTPHRSIHKRSQLRHRRRCLDHRANRTQSPSMAVRRRSRLK